MSLLGAPQVHGQAPRLRARRNPWSRSRTSKRRESHRRFRSTRTPSCGSRGLDFPQIEGHKRDCRRQGDQLSLSRRRSRTAWARSSATRSRGRHRTKWSRPQGGLPARSATSVFQSVTNRIIHADGVAAPVTSGRRARPRWLLLVEVAARARRSVRPTMRAPRRPRWCQPSAPPWRSGRSARRRRSAR
jgi:hypothetical protein